MSSLFERTSINGMELKNRFVRSATHEGMADENGFPSERLFKLYERLGKGGVGLLVTGYAYVSRDGITPFYRMLGIDRDELVPKYRELVNLVHEYDTAIALQIAHCGRQTVKQATGTTPIAPSAVRDPGTGTIPREMTEEDIERLIDAFAQAARRARESGFDAVQIHCAHGYLLSQFTSPHTNRRQDRWGGSTENRMRFVSEIYQRCRKQVGEDYPVLIKYSAWDKMEDGLKPEEGIVMGEMMAAMGLDGIEVSCGIGGDGGATMLGNASPGTRPPQAYNLETAKALKSKVDVPVMTVGGFTEPAAMKTVIERGDADYISLCRALISDPDFPNKIQQGSSEPVRCVQCNLCLGYIVTEPLRCYHGKVLKDKEPMRTEILVLD
jgi:2,4-dienoyl-CoA reductase-like NADH-dependent reductase (Old Yellow Enzyme family)